MYVACTRAEYRLVLSACVKVDEEQGTIKNPASSSLLATIWQASEAKFELVKSEYADADAEQSKESELKQNLLRLKPSFRVVYPAAFEWQTQQQLLSEDAIPEQEKIDKGSIEYEWATEVATAVGIVLHNWLQHNSQRLYAAKIDDALISQWRAELAGLRVPAERRKWALSRLEKAITNMQSDEQAQFIFRDYTSQKNEFGLTAYENGVAKRYQIDRTFIDAEGVRWIVDYKTTSTKAEDLDAFVDQQIKDRHCKQLEQYGALMHEFDPRPIKLAVYFPLLLKLRCWNFQ